MAAEKLNIGGCYLSSYQRRFQQPQTATEKFMEILYITLDHICHCSVQKSYTERWLKVTNLSKARQFKQTQF